MNAAGLIRRTAREEGWARDPRLSNERDTFRRGPLRMRVTWSPGRGVSRAVLATTEGTGPRDHLAGLGMVHVLAELDGQDYARPATVLGWLTSPRND